MAPNSASRERERRVIIGGVLVSVAGLLIAYGVLPFARHWRDRQAVLVALRAEADSLAGLVASAPRLEASAAEQERALAGSSRRVLHAKSATLAANALQSMLQDASDASHLVLTRLDVAQDLGQAPNTFQGTTSDTGRGAPPAAVQQTLPATMAAYCDVVGLAALLDHLARGPRLVVVERITVQQNSALRGAPDMLQVTLALRAPVVME